MPGCKGAYDTLMATRPTAVNLRWALDDMRERLLNQPQDTRVGVAYERAAEVCDEDVAICSAIGDHGAKLIQEAYEIAPGDGPVNILTHCNAGWLATVGLGHRTGTDLQGP